MANNKKKDTNVDIILGRLVVEKNLCTEAEVDECLEVMKNLARQSKPYACKGKTVRCLPLACDTSWDHLHWKS